MLTRRQLLSMALPALVVRAAWAENSAGIQTQYGIPRKAWVSAPPVIRQECPQWCWAASMAMIFARHGRVVDQKTIVDSTFGGLMCASAPDTLTIASGLSRSWVDANGQPFSSTVTSAYDPANNIVNLNNLMIIDELSNNRPLLYCNRHHAMVLVVLDYMDTRMGPSPYAAAVLDPWPGSPDWHYLSPGEFTPVHLGGEMTFLASVDIQ